MIHTETNTLLHFSIDEFQIDGSKFLMDTIYFYHFMSLSRSLTLPGCHKVSAKQNILISFFYTSTDQDEI